MDEWYKLLHPEGMVWLARLPHKHVKTSGDNSVEKRVWVKTSPCKRSLKRIGVALSGP